MKKFNFMLFLLVFTVGLSACKPAEPVCPPGSIGYHENASGIPLANIQSNTATTESGETIEINGKEIPFDSVIHGPLCNNSLRGTVYVACDIEIPKWQDNPDFFKDCDFSVEPGTVIYVAAHNNAAYYKGCASCHGSKGAVSP